MRKWIILILTTLVLVNLAGAIEDCKRVMNPEGIPCMVISSWQFPNICGDYTMKIYNSTPTLLDTWTLDNYSITGRCNVTFNYTKTGSYLMNWSSGDSAKIIVEVSTKMQIAIAIVLSAVAVIFIAFGVMLYLKRKE